MAAPKLDDQLCFALYAASRAVTRAYGPILAELGLTYPQYIVMLLLWEEDDRTVSELGERLGLDSGTLTPLLRRLEALGLVTRARSTEDERVVRIQLSAAGKRLERKAEKVPAAIGCRLGVDASPGRWKELVKLRDALTELTCTLEGD
ncbi:MAG: MarR family transcriptional regulator [Polyangiaceae bacterium]